MFYSYTSSCCCIGTLKQNPRRVIVVFNRGVLIASFLTLSSATCRRPIRGAAARAGLSTDAWLDDSRLRLTDLRETSYSSSSSYVESRPSSRLLSSPAPVSTYSSAAAPRLVSASVPTVRAPISGGGSGGVPARRRRWLPVWVQVLVFGVLAGFLFLVYQAMETNESNPFGFLTQQSEEVPAGQTSK